MALPSYIGRYSVREEIARGGFAHVVQAFDEELESYVAIKILLPEMAKNQELLNRFLEEARLLRRIRCSNVITVHDVGRLGNGCPYFVMDYADRGTLVPRLKKYSSKSDLHNVSILVDAISNGLAALHESGIVHRDIKPANILFQLARRQPVASNQTDDLNTRSLVKPDERVLIGDLGIAKDMLRHSGLTTVMAGTPLYQAPEQLDPKAMVETTADIYAASAMLWHILTGNNPPQPYQVEQSLENLPVMWHDVLSQGMAIDPHSRFDSIDEWRVAIHRVLSGQDLAGDSGSVTASVTQSAQCPYKGLAAYQPEDAQFFFGRDDLIDELVRRIQSNSVLIVSGSSGSGKSSLVRAGLIPALQAGSITGSGKWRLGLFTPGRDPMAELYLQLKSLAPEMSTPISLDDLLLHPAMARHLSWSEGSGEDAPLVLFIDQFEELFTLAPESQIEPFIEALSAMTDPVHSKVRVVITVRADFYGACSKIPWLAERITQNQVLVGPMTAAELRRAISGPAQQSKLYLESELVDTIVEEAGSETGTLPLVAHALLETWTRRRGNTLTLEAYKQAGGMIGAISQTADSIYEQSFDEQQRQVTRRLFLRLVTPGDGTPDTRRILDQSDIDKDENPQVTRKVIETLVNARLLTLDDTSVQIAHEAILRNWPRLNQWIDQSRDDLRTRQRISYAAQQWDGEQRNVDLLYRGTQLLAALEWADQNPDQLGLLEQEFLNASEKVKIETEAIAAEQENKARRNRQIAVTLLSILAIGATVASLIAFLGFKQARHNEQRAEFATIEAHERFAGALGSAAHGLVSDDPLLALVLGAEAIQRAEINPPDFQARATLVQARHELARSFLHPVGSPIEAGDAIAVALSPDGSLLASGRRDGSIGLIDVASGQQKQNLTGHQGGVRDLDFTKDGNRLVSIGTDGTIRLWQLKDGLSVDDSIIGKTGDVIMGLGLNLQGTHAATANGDGKLQLWDLSQQSGDGEILLQDTLEFNAVTFSPDGQGLVTGYSDGTMYGLNLVTQEPLFDPIKNAHGSNYRFIIMSPNGKRFATVSVDSTSKLFDYPSGKLDSQLFDSVKHIGAVAFTSDDRYLIGGTGDGSLKIWDLVERKVVASTTAGHDQSIVDMQTDRNNILLATLGREQLIRMWRANYQYPVAASYAVEGKARGVAFSADGKWLAIGADSGIVKIWNIQSGEQSQTITGHNQQVWALAFSPDSRFLASADRSGQLNVWDIESGEVQWSVNSDDIPIWSVAFINDGKQLVTASDQRIKIRENATGELINNISNGDTLTRMTVFPDGHRIAVSTSNGQAKIWDIEKGEIINTFTVDDNLIWSVAISPDGLQLATASSDEVVVLWSVESGEQLAVLTGHTGGATDSAYLADGVTLVVTDRSGKLHFWDTITRRRLDKPISAHSGASWRVALHPDGFRFATSGEDGLARAWDELSIEKACEIGLPGFDAKRREQYIGINEKSVACD